MVSVDMEPWIPESRLPRKTDWMVSVDFRYEIVKQCIAGGLMDRNDMPFITVFQSAQSALRAADFNASSFADYIGPDVPLVLQNPQNGGTAPYPISAEISWVWLPRAAFYSPGVGMPLRNSSMVIAAALVPLAASS